MAIVYTPITLDVGRYLESMTKLIGDVRFTNTLEVTQLTRNAIDAIRVGQVDFGYGIVYDFIVDVQNVEDLTEESVVLRVVKPQVEQEIIVIDTYKRTQVSISDILVRSNFLDGSMTSKFTEKVMKILETTYNHFMYKQFTNLYMNWTPIGNLQKVEVEMYDIAFMKEDGASPQEINDAEKYNGISMAKSVRKVINNMQILQSGYTDMDKYISSNDGQEYDVKSALDNSELTMFINDLHWTNYLATSLASIYHNEELKGMFPKVKEVLIPEVVHNEYSKNDVILTLTVGNKFALAEFYKLTLSFNDASNLYTNFFLHFAYGLGNFKYAPAVQFVVKYI